LSSDGEVGKEEGLAVADTMENLLSANPYLPGRGRTKQEWLPSYLVTSRGVRNNIHSYMRWGVAVPFCCVESRWSSKLPQRCRSWGGRSSSTLLLLLPSRKGRGDSSSFSVWSIAPNDLGFLCVDVWFRPFLGR
jgi:hypothetical protein